MKMNLIPDKINTHEELILALKDAVELEMSLMIQYIYAAYSVPNLITGKQYLERGIWKPEHLEFMCGDGKEKMNQGVRGIILRIAKEEMMHFLMANNLLMAVGGSFHICTPDFSKMSMFYPLGVEMALEPFSEPCLERFMHFEWPSYYSDRTNPSLGNNAKTTYNTISNLYQKIRKAFQDHPEYILVDKKKTGGEHHLFLNQKTNKHHPDYQCQVDDLSSALFTIDLITEQGEGASIKDETINDSHFRKFEKMYQTLQKFNAKDEWFQAYPALKNPSISGKAGTNKVLDAEAVEVMHIFNECFDISLQMIVQHFGKKPTESLRRSKWMNASIDIMLGLMRPLGALLMSMKSGIPGSTAGPSFELEQPIQYIPYEIAAKKIISQKFERLYATAQKLDIIPDSTKELLHFFISFTHTLD
ncbi:hypothetical protein NIES4071_25790 [Calothrix sp. NIES-4071]|nr:hypothetical protein NIES4071_25790 [Calothrix sp. NIES-4071]BAZ56901.1 hypothetical protein NIES4105_25730 [Calothrix sp. NIES-4105]